MSGFKFLSVTDGLLVQETDNTVIKADDLTVVSSRKPLKNKLFVTISRQICKQICLCISENMFKQNIDLYPKIQSENEVVILPTVIFYDEGEEVERLQGDMSFSLKVTEKELEEIIEEILGSKF